MKLLSFNIQYGFGADGIYDLARSAAVIKGADIAALQEVDRHWSRSGHDDEPARNWTEGQAPPPCPASILWMGDFNMEPGSAEYHALIGQSPYHPGARYEGGLIDAVAAQVHTHDKLIAGRRRLRQLDHIFASADLAPRLMRAWVDVDCGASDHLPLWVEMAGNPSALCGGA
jgi:endonuclease/exonuclease/phosphatase family metal-dependent hydrolase